MGCDRRPRQSVEERGRVESVVVFVARSVQVETEEGNAPRTPLYTRDEACGPENKRNMLRRPCHSPRGPPSKRIVEQGMWPLESVPLKHTCAARSKEPIVSKRLVVAVKARHRCRPSESVVSLLAGLTLHNAIPQVLTALEVVYLSIGHSVLDRLLRTCKSFRVRAKNN